MVSTEVIVSLQEELYTDIIVDSDICTVENTELVGCYNCEKGAYAKIKCFASRSSEAEIICDSTSFTAPCGRQGIESIMRISATQAMMHMKCSVSCGEVVTKFEVGGILKYTATFQTVLYKWLTSLTAAELDGETTFLSAMLNTASPQAEFLEPQLQAILNSLHKQLNVATTQRLDWTSLQTEASFREAPIESDRQVQAGLIPRARRFQWLERGSKQEHDNMEEHLVKLESKQSIDEETTLAVRCQQLQKQLDNLELERAEQVAKLEKENEECQKEISVLKEQAKSQQEEAQADWIQQIEEAAHKSEDDQKEIALLKEKIKLGDDELKAAFSSMEKLKDKLSTLEDELDTKTRNAGALINNLGTLLDKNEKKKMELAELRQELKEEKSRSEEMTQKMK
ncbi:unnamed protein product, partial [Cylicostephanus goldi]